jgi:hypothetical protein
VSEFYGDYSINKLFIVHGSADKAMYIVMSPDQNAERSQNVQIEIRYFERLQD